MRSSVALIWKEWRQHRWFLAAGVALFTIWPLIDALNNYWSGHGFRSDMPEAMAMLLGGPFAILVAVGATSQDLNERLACFWQSRPVSVWRWTVTKYLMGLAVVLLALCFPLVMRVYMIGRQDDAQHVFAFDVLGCHTFTWVLIYSLAFLTSCLIRRPVYAAIFSAALALLVYFLPVLVPPLESLSIFNIMTQWPLRIVPLTEAATAGQWFAAKLRILKIPWAGGFALQYNIDLLRYIVFVLVCSFAAAIISAITVKRNWQLHVGQKLMFWSLGVVGLLLFCTVAFQLGSNLECIQQIAMKEDDANHYYGIAMIIPNGEQGLLVLYNRPWGRWISPVEYSLRAFRFSQGEAELGKEITLAVTKAPAFSFPPDKSTVAWSTESPQWLYFLEESVRDLEDGHKEVRLYLNVTILDSEAGEATNISKVELGSYKFQPPQNHSRPGGQSIVLHGKTVYGYILGKFVSVDVSDPEKPKVRDVFEKYHPFSGIIEGRRELLMVRLVRDDKLSGQERLKITVSLGGQACEGRMAVFVSEDFIKTYQLKEVTEDIATFELTGYRKPTPLERLVGSKPGQVFLRNRLAYVLDEYGVVGGLTVYDVSQPGRIRRVGHYAAPNESLMAIAPLGDGNILVGGGNLRIVAPPRAAKTQDKSGN